MGPNIYIRLRLPPADLGVVGGLLPGGVGIQVPPEVLHLLLQLPHRAVLGALRARDARASREEEEDMPRGEGGCGCGGGVQCEWRSRARAEKEGDP